MQYDQYGMPVGYPAPAYPIPGQAPAIDAAPGRPRRKVSKRVMIGVPALVVAIVAGVLIAVNLGNSLDPAVAKVSCNNPGDLASCIVQPPAGSSKASSSWASNTTVDAAAYAAAYADSAANQQPSSVMSLITNDGLKGIAHRSWTQGSNQVDLILLRFDSPQGAQAWANDRTAEFLSLGTGPQLTVPQIPAVKAYSTAAPDSAGYVNARLMTTVGDVDLEVHYSSQSTMQQQDLNIWAGTEYQSLSTAPTVSPSPSPTATTFETVTCPGNLNDCMMPYPSGGQQLTGVPNKYTVESFTKDFIKQEDAQAATQRMKDDNVFDIDSEAWAVSTGYGQLVLAQTRTEKQAQDLFGYFDRGDNTYPSTFPIPGSAGAVGRYFSTADSQGFYDGLITSQAGDIYVAMVVGFTGSFDVSTAQAWAVQELNLLTQKIQGNWAVPIPQVSTPSLPAFTPGTCPSSGLTGCMIPTPSGATPGNTVRDIGVVDYVNSVFSDRQAYEQTWLTSDGAKDAVTESWTGSGGASATDYILSFASSRQAKAAALQEAGDSTAGSQSCSLLSLPNLYCMVLPENVSNGQVPIRIVAWSGKYELDLEFTQNAPGSISTSAADTSDALSWAQAQLQLLAGG